MLRTHSGPARPEFGALPAASTDFVSFGLASPVPRALRRTNGTNSSAGDTAHKFVQRIEIGKRRARVASGIAFGREVSLFCHSG